MSAPRELKRRVWLTTSIVIVIAAGLASRSGVVALPGVIETYAGDTLWAALVFLLLAVAMPRRPVPGLAATALAFAFAVELLQLYQVPWLDAIRDTLPGRLVLGQGFLFSDLLCYALGIGVAALVYQACSEGHARDFKTIAGTGIILTVLVAIIASNLGHGPQMFGFLDKVPGKDKTGHFLLMGALSFFVVLMLAPRLRMRHRQACTLIVVGLCVIIGLEEGSQYFISTRSFSVADLVCSWGGIAVFGTIASALVGRKGRMQ